jgi:acyl-CoA synthetase (AMP-forming)/AMP-acid ligase II/acyl carrier protein
MIARTPDITATDAAPDTVTGAYAQGSCVPPDSADCIGDILCAVAQEQPAAPVIVAPEAAPLTYGALWEQVQRTRSELSLLGVGRGSVVATALPPGPVAAAALLSFASAASVAPVNPVLTQRELSETYRRLDPDLVAVAEVGPRAPRAAAESLGLPTVILRGDPAGEAGRYRLLSIGNARAAFARDLPERDGSPAAGDITLILSTSGTTGQPKLVPLTHANVLAAARATCAVHGLGPGDVRLNVMPLFHVQGLVGAVVAAVASGGSVVCTEGFDATRIPRHLEEHGVTWFSGSPTMYRELLRTADGAGAPAPASLRFLRVGSAALPASLRAQLEDRFAVPVVESYGMTEAHQIASTPLPPGGVERGAVGHPTGCDVRIATTDGEPAAWGEQGEILIRGPNVAPGYLVDGEVDTSALRGGWFATGDVGSLDPEGRLTIVGRLGEFINRGGEKVSPYEVEEQLGAHPGVCEAAVFGIPHADYDEDVVAAVVSNPCGSVTERELRAFLADRLAPFKRPRRIYFVESLPRGATGKLERGRLADICADAPDEGALGEDTPESNGRAVRTRQSATEIALLALWRSTLESDDLTADDDFFTAGGDSLAGMALLAEVASVFAVEIPPLDMYEHANTVRKMAAYIDRVREGAAQP